MIQKTHDGRTRRTGKDYSDFRKAIWAMQDYRCGICGRFVSFDAEFWHIHHLGGRGMGGSRRDDVPEAVMGLCTYCHRSEHGQ